MARLSDLLSILALAAIANAAPPLLSNARPSGTKSPIGATGTAAATVPAATASTTPITIPESVIDAAPILDLEISNTVESIPAAGANSTLTDARPDLEEYVETTIVTDNNATTSKRNLVKRNPLNCNPNQVPTLDVKAVTWEHIATRVCEAWYPDESAFEWDPASPWPNALKGSVLGPMNVGNGKIVKFEFTYGVNDWGLQAGLGWQIYYVPQTQALCIADLKTLIGEMQSDCAFNTGYDTAQDTSGTGQPKWYTFIAS